MQQASYVNKYEPTRKYAALHRFEHRIHLNTAKFNSLVRHNVAHKATDEKVSMNLPIKLPAFGT